MVKSNRPRDAAQITSNLKRVSYRLVCSIAQRLGVWALPIVVGALVIAELSSRFSFFGNGPMAPIEENAEAKRVQLLRNDVLYYTSDLGVAVKLARRRGRDMLASFDVFQSALRVTSAGWPCAIKRVEIRLEERGTERRCLRTSQPTVVIDQTNFVVLRPLLKELQTVILEGDGTGRGKLPESPYYANPVERDKWHILEEPDFDAR